jgi:hypothetical protein
MKVVMSGCPRSYARVLPRGGKHPGDDVSTLYSIAARGEFVKTNNSTTGKVMHRSAIAQKADESSRTYEFVPKRLSRSRKTIIEGLPTGV